MTKTPWIQALGGGRLGSIVTVVLLFLRPPSVFAETQKPRTYFVMPSDDAVNDLSGAFTLCADKLDQELISTHGFQAAPSGALRESVSDCMKDVLPPDAVRSCESELATIQVDYLIRLSVTDVGENWVWTAKALSPSRGTRIVWSKSEKVETPDLKVAALDGCSALGRDFLCKTVGGPGCADQPRAEGAGGEPAPVRAVSSGAEVTAKPAVMNDPAGPLPTSATPAVALQTVAVGLSAPDLVSDAPSSATEVTAVPVTSTASNPENGTFVLARRGPPPVGRTIRSETNIAAELETQLQQNGQQVEFYTTASNQMIFESTFNEADHVQVYVKLDKHSTSSDDQTEPEVSHGVLEEKTLEGARRNGKWEFDMTNSSGLDDSADAEIEALEVRFSPFGEGLFASTPRTIDESWQLDKFQVRKFWQLEGSKIEGIVDMKVTAVEKCGTHQCATIESIFNIQGILVSNGDELNLEVYGTDRRIRDLTDGIDLSLRMSGTMTLRPSGGNPAEMVITGPISLNVSSVIR